MKLLFLILSLALNSNPNNSQPIQSQKSEGPLKITIQEEGSEDMLVWYFPSGSIFTVLGENEELAIPTKTTNSCFEYQGDLTLVINPAFDVAQEDVMKYSDKVVKIYPGTVTEKVYFRTE